jgi:NAD(P)-dependent dehydrogenase (short-subunit alcohol dehydrogenase family)
MTDHATNSSKPEEAPMDRTVAVTGGSGKLGRAVVAALIDEGWDRGTQLDQPPARQR